MKENILVSEPSSPTKNPSENVENNLVGAEVDAQEVGDGGLFLFYMFAVVAFLFALTLRSGIYEYFYHMKWHYDHLQEIALLL